MNTYRLSIFATLMIFSFTTRAQSNKLTNGIYTNSKDFISQNLSDPFQSDNTNDELRTNKFLNGSNIKVIIDGQENKLKKDEIYGYRYGQENFRVYKKYEYKIIDTVGFYMYTHIELEPGRKGLVPQEVYYFSSTPTGEIQRLTLKNLEMTFAKNTGFRYSVAGLFHDDSELIEFDRTLNTYVIKHVYLDCLKA